MSCNLVNIGHSSRLPYDGCAYKDRLYESTGPLGYKLDANQIHNCTTCLSTLGPRSSYMGEGVSTTVGTPVATSQKLVDVESVLKNLNVPTSKCKVGNVNNINLSKVKLQNPRLCNKFLDPLSSRLTFPASTYRDMAINRFYNLPTDPQSPIFWNFEIDSRLEAKDNFIWQLPTVRGDASLPTEIKGRVPPCRTPCAGFCPIGK